jgi:hypothetical protein
MAGGDASVADESRLGIGGQIIKADGIAIDR